MRRHSPGFSLIELMVVVVVIGIISGIAVPMAAKVRARAQEGSVMAAAQSLQMQIESYINMTRMPPANHAEFNRAATLDDPNGGCRVTLTVNPFSDATTTIGPTGVFSAGNLGYSYNPDTRMYRIEAYGKDENAGPNGDGVIVLIEAY